MFIKEFRIWIGWAVRENISLLAQFSIHVILSRVYVQLDTRPIKEELWEGRFLKEDCMFVEDLWTWIGWVVRGK